jgi:hypothetical protein
LPWLSELRDQRAKDQRTKDQGRPKYAYSNRSATNGSIRPARRVGATHAISDGSKHEHDGCVRDPISGRDAEREGQHRNRGEAGSVGQAAEAVPKIVRNVLMSANDEGDRVQFGSQAKNLAQ